MLRAIHAKTGKQVEIGEMFPEDIEALVRWRTS